MRTFKRTFKGIFDMRLLSRFVVAGAIVAAGAASARAQEAVQYYHLDVTGSVRAVTDQNGNVVERHDYLPFGQEWNPPAGSQPRLFLAAEHDPETGLDYLVGRYYAAGTARFTTTDFAIFADPSNPQSWHLYVYGLNNPLTFPDPSGHEPQCPTAYCESVTVKADLPTDTWIRTFSLTSLLESTRDSTREVAKAVMSWLNAPRDPGCMWNWTNAGASIGASYGLWGAVGGPTVGVTVPGAAAFGGVTGGLVGATACMTNNGNPGATSNASSAAKVTFGHGGRHLANTELSEPEVENAIRSEVQSLVRGSSATGEFWGRVMVRGREVFYRAFTRPDGTINIGTYTVGAP